MSVSIFLCIISILTQLTLGLLVFVRGPLKKPNQIFSFQLLLFLIWTAGELNLIYNGISDLGIKLMFTPAVLLAYFFCVFAAIFPEPQPEAFVIKNKINSLLAFIPAAFLLYLIWSGNLFTSIAEIPAGFSFKFGKSEFVIKGILIGYLFLSLTTLSKSRKQAKSPIQYRRLRYTFTAMLLPIAAGSIFIAFSKFYMESGTAYSFGIFPALSIAMGVILSYTMLKYSLMEIDLIFSIGLVYTLLTAILAGSMELMQELMQNILDLSGVWSKILSTLTIAALFSPLKDLLNSLVDKFFGRQNFDSATVMRHIIDEMRKSKNETAALKRLVSELKLVIDFSICNIRVNGKDHLFPDDGQPFPEIEDAFPEGIYELEEILAYKQSSDPECAFADKWRESGYRYIFRIYDQKKFFGFCFLGPKTSKVPYTENELSLVKEVVSEIPHIFSNFQMILELLEHDRSKQEISWAQKMLRAISADKNIDRFHEFEIETYSSLSKEIKGDMIDIMDGPQTSFIALYDAFHHGIKAVLTLNLVFSIFRSAIPTERFKKLNEVLRSFSAFSLSSAVTLIVPEKGQLAIFNAGNPSPLFLAGKVCKKIVESGKPLGLEEQEFVESTSISYPDKDELLFVSSNGLYKLFEDSKAGDLINFLKEKNTGCIKKLASEIKAIISSEFSQKGFKDDITFFLLKRRVK